MNQLGQRTETREGFQVRLSRRDFLRLLGTGVSLAGINGFLVACSAKTAPSATPTSPALTTAPGGGIATNVTLTLPITSGLSVILDPHKAVNDVFFFNLFDYIYGGLVKFDKDAHVTADLAERWEISTDGLVYTFHLRDGIVFASGRPVTPDDFLYSWKRSLDPKTPSPIANFLESLVGYDEFTKGQTTELAGFKKIDDKTLQLTITTPINYFLSYLCTYTCFVVDKVLVEKYGGPSNGDWANNQPYGTGAWKVSKFDPDTGIEMIPNENYWGKPSPSVVKLNWPIIKGPTAANQALNLYKANQADIVSNFPLALLDAVEQDYKDQIVPVSAAATDSIAMSFAKKPFDNVLVRRAFAMAIDRDTYDTVIWRGRFKPTDCFVPPSVKDYTCAPGIQYNLDEAKKVLAAAGFPNGQGLTPVTFYVGSERSAEDVNRYRALVDMWTKGLGVDVQFNTALTSSQIDDKFAAEKGLQMYDAGWNSITETPQLLSEVFRINSVYMKDSFDWGLPVPKMSYDGVDYDPAADAKTADGLLAQADIEQDPQKRNALYIEAEALILKNAVYVPVGNFVIRELVRPKIMGLEWGGLFHTYPRSIEKNVSVLR